MCLKKIIQPYQGLMNQNVPMVCGGAYRGMTVLRKCYYLGKITSN